MNSDDTVPRIRLDARIRRVGESLVLGGPPGPTLELSESAALAFRQIDGTRTIAEIAARVAAHYDVADEIVRPDIEEIVADLRSAGIVSVPATPVPAAGE